MILIPKFLLALWLILVRIFKYCTPFYSLQVLTDDGSTYSLSTSDAYVGWYGAAVRVALSAGTTLSSAHMIHLSFLHIQALLNANFHSATVLVERTLRLLGLATTVFTGWLQQFLRTLLEIGQSSSPHIL
jgi:hypothetical protein